MKNRKKSTRQLVGIEDIVAGGVQTADGELTFYLVQPTNLNVLPDQGVRSRVMALLNVLKAMAEIELLAQTMMASSREFCFVLRQRKTDGAVHYAAVEQQLRDSGFAVRRAEGQKLLELLAIYFEQDATHESFDLVDGARWLTTETEE